MSKLVNFLLFQGVWFAAVMGAAEGHVWLGPLVALVATLVHLWMVDTGRERVQEVVYLLVIGVTGTAIDSLLQHFGVLRYPTSAQHWSLAIVPPWITSLWVIFATTPRFSLGWLMNRPWLAFAFGAVGGPLAFLAGTRFEAIAAGSSGAMTMAALALEYALLTPLMLRFSPSRLRASEEARA